jgi:hypothetical protein
VTVSVVRKSMVHHNWRRPPPRPIVIPKVMTLEDVRALVHRHLPAEYSKQTWRRVASIATAAARGQLPADDVAVALKLVLSIEGINAV